MPRVRQRYVDPPAELGHDVCSLLPHQLDRQSDEAEKEARDMVAENPEFSRLVAASIATCWRCKFDHSQALEMIFTDTVRHVLQ